MKNGGCCLPARVGLFPGRCIFFSYMHGLCRAMYQCDLRVDVTCNFISFSRYDAMSQDRGYGYGQGIEWGKVHSYFCLRGIFSVRLR
jgi:hypothetical protein